MPRRVPDNGPFCSGLTLLATLTAVFGCADSAAPGAPQSLTPPAAPAPPGPLPASPTPRGANPTPPVQPRTPTHGSTGSAAPPPANVPPATPPAMLPAIAAGQPALNPSPLPRDGSSASAGSHALAGQTAAPPSNGGSPGVSLGTGGASQAGNSAVQPPPAPAPLAPIIPQFVKRELDSGYHNAAATVGDFTGDGQLDIMAAGGEDLGVYLYAAPDFTRAQIHTTASAIHSVSIDVDRDGDMDAVFCRFDPGLIFWMEQPEGAQISAQWEQHVIDGKDMGGPDGVHGLALADVDGDGQVDLLATAGVQQSIFAYNIPVDAKQPWTRRTLVDGDAPGLTHYVGAGDINGDGRIDVATGGKRGNFFAWWQQPENANAEWTQHHLSKESGSSQIEVTDINGDQIPDLLAARGHGNGLLWYEGPNFEIHSVDDSMVWPHAMDYGDIDNDGDIDVVAASATKAQGVAWFENDGLGNFTKHPLDSEQKSYQATLVDLDRDGDQDVVLSGQETRNVVLFENLGADAL